MVCSKVKLLTFYIKAGFEQKCVNCYWPTSDIQFNSTNFKDKNRWTVFVNVAVKHFTRSDGINQLRSNTF